MSNYQRTASWLAACGKLPSPENLSLQIGCDLEESVEFIEQLNITSREHRHLQTLLQSAVSDLKYIATTLKQRKATATFANCEEALDALCDREVTGNGVAYLAGFNKEGADEAVLASNDAKLVDGKPVILEGGKIGKPEGWQAPNLKPFVV